MAQIAGLIRGVATGKTKGQIVAECIKEGITLPDQQAEFTLLCDVAEVERICELVTEAFAGRRLGGGEAGFTVSLKRRLVYPLQRFMDSLAPADDASHLGVRVEIQPTRELLSAIERIVDQMERGPWDVRTGELAASDLQAAWFKWIAYVASYWLWAKVPELLAQVEIRREQGRLGGKATKRGQQRRSDKKFEIVSRYGDLRRTMAPRDVAGAVARQLGCTATYVRQVWREHLKSYPLEKAKLQAAL